METGNRIIRGQIFLKYNNWLLLAEDCLDVSRLLFRVLGPVKDFDFNVQKKTIAFLFVRVYRACRACFLLFTEGFAHESHIPLRTAFEHLIDMKYLQKFPDEINTFWEYGAVGHHRKLKVAGKFLPKIPFPKDYVDKVNSLDHV